MDGKRSFRGFPAIGFYHFDDGAGGKACLQFIFKALGLSNIVGLQTVKAMLQRLTTLKTDDDRSLEIPVRIHGHVGEAAGDGFVIRRGWSVYKRAAFFVEF